MKNIVFIAPPAAGKGTQAKMICDAYKVPHISTGDLLRNAAEEGTEMGKFIQKQMTEGKLIGDDVVLSLLKQRLTKEDCENGYILDGFPRNLSQAKEYDKMLHEVFKKVECALVLDLDYEVAKNRITGRVSCPNCGHVYNNKISALSPKTKDICDFCSQKLIQRKDDNEETFQKRFETYIKETAPLIDYYEKQNILVHINSNRDANEIFNDIREVIS